MSIQHQQHLANQLLSSFKNQIGTDISIKCQEETYKAHRFVLASASPVFRTMLYNNHGMKESSNGTIDLTSSENVIDYSAFSSVLEYMYSGSIEIQGSLDKCISVLKIAHLYEMNELFMSSEEILVPLVNCTNYLALFQLSRDYDLKRLCDQCVTVVAQNFETIRKGENKEELIGLNVDEVVMLLSSSNMWVCDELTVVLFVELYASSNILNQEACVRLLDKVLGQNIPSDKVESLKESCQYLQRVAPNSLRDIQIRNLKREVEERENKLKIAQNAYLNLANRSGMYGYVSHGAQTHYKSATWDSLFSSIVTKPFGRDYRE